MVGHLQQKDVETLKHWTDIFFQSQVGYINVTNTNNYGRWYGFNDIEKLVADTKGKYKQYLSINSFGVDKHSGFPRRKKSNVKQIRTVAVDIDQYTKGLNIDDVMDMLHVLVESGKLPEPNLVTRSNGVQIFYKIAGGSSPAMEWLTHIITCRFIELLEGVGADYKASDITRLMRVPGSVNEKNKATIQWDIWNDEPYSLDILRKYTHVDQYRPPQHHGQRAEVIHIDEVKKLNSRRDFFFRTNHARMRDLETLFELRHGDFTHLRNQFVYVYAYHYSLIHSERHSVLNHIQALIQDIYSNESDSFTFKEIKNTVFSAFEDAKTFYKKYKSDGYKIIYGTADGIIKPKKNSTIIKELAITEAEQMALNRLYSPKFKQSKETERAQNNRRNQGAISRAAYEKNRKTEKQQQIERVRILKGQGMKQKEIAERFGKSKAWVSKLLKEGATNE